MNIIKVIRLFLFAFSLCFGQSVFAQEENVKIIEDPRIDSLIRVQGRHHGGMINGFRIQLTTEKSKNDIDQTRKKFISRFPTVPTYVIYSAPNYILTVGDFRHKEDAVEVHNQLKNFPYSFIKEELVQSNSK